MKELTDLSIYDSLPDKSLLSTKDVFLISDSLGASSI